MAENGIMMLADLPPSVSRAEESAPRVLLVDDVHFMRVFISELLRAEGCAVQLAESAERALDFLQHAQPDVALVDVVLPQMSGIELLARIKQRWPDTEVVMMSGQASLVSAIQSLRQGAYDFVQKPFTRGDPWETVRRAFDKRRLSARNRELMVEKERRNQELSDSVARLSSMIEASGAMAKISSLPELFEFFVRLVARELDVERASLMVLDASSQTLSIAAHRGTFSVDPTQVRVKVGEGISGRVAETREPILVEDISCLDTEGLAPNDASSESFISAPIELSVPIMARTELHGVINVTNRRGRRQFDERDLAFLSGLASQLAVAIERAQHIESLLDAQQELIASERIKALGQVAAGVAHDFNNVLSVILVRTESALENTGSEEIDREVLQKDLRFIRKHALQGAATIKRIQDFTRTRKDAPAARVSLNEVVREATEMTRPKWKETAQGGLKEIDVTLLLGEIPDVLGDAQELIQAVGNLTFNAVEAMPEGGLLIFKTWAEEGNVLLRIQDTGIGMDEATKQKVFEPFFTTKETGQGLGMSIVYSIISRHSGRIEVETAPRGGTTFTISIPQAPSVSASGLAPIQVASQRSTQTANILLVDDQTDLLEAFRETLTHHGHRVVAVGSAEEALSQFQLDRFNLVITDLSMRGMSGLEFTQCIKRIEPNLPVALLSGSLMNDEPELKRVGVDFVLCKPCRTSELLDLIATVASQRALS